ncbi:hypothetical protein, partial [Shewanella algae]
TPLHIAVGLHLQHGSLKSLWGGVHFISSEYCYIFAMPCPLPGKGETVSIRSKVFSKEKQALVEMAKMDKKNGGVTQGDMDAYAELNAELSDPFPSNQVRGLETHPDRANGSEPHGHVGPVNHIPEKKIED